MIRKYLKWKMRKAERKYLRACENLEMHKRISHLETPVTEIITDTVNR